MRVRHWEDWAILGVAAWLYAAPFVLGIASIRNPATMLSWSCAVVLMISAAEALAFPDVIEEWVDIVAGLALVAGPWLFDFSHDAGATGNSVMAGAVVTALAVSALRKDWRAGQRAA